MGRSRRQTRRQTLELLGSVGLASTRWAAALGASVAGATSGCLSPTLPLPPPDEPENIAFDEELGGWQVRGACQPGATVLVKNLATGLITGVDDQRAIGRYFVLVEGEPCDRMEVSQLVDGETSSATGFVLEERVNGLTVAGSCIPA